MTTEILTEQIVAEFDFHESAEKAIHQLSDAKFDMKNLTILGRDYHTEEHPVGYINTGDRMLAWGKMGAFWGSIWGILFGSAVIFVPGVGSVVFAGWIVTTLFAALEGAAVGAGIGAIGAALSGIGIPDDKIIAYETAIKAGKFLVIVRGTLDETERAKVILRNFGATGLDAVTSTEPATAN